MYVQRGKKIFTKIVKFEYQNVVIKRFFVHAELKKIEIDPD